MVGVFCLVVATDIQLDTEGGGLTNQFSRPKCQTSAQENCWNMTFSYAVTLERDELNKP